MKRLIYIMILAGSLCVNSFAGESEDRIVAQVCQNNLELLSAKEAMNGDILSVKSENNLADPEVELEYMFTHPERGLELTVTEEFEWPGVYFARRKYIRHQISAFEYIYQSKEIEVRQSARLVLADLVNLNKRIALQHAILEKEQSLLDNYMTGNLHGEFTIIDINKLKVELFEVNSTLKNLLVQRKVVLESLTALNGGKPLQELDEEMAEYPINELKGVVDYIDAYHNNSPEYLAGIQQSLAGSQMRKVAKMGYLPHLNVGYKYQNEDGEKGHGFILGISVPLFSNRHKVKISKAQANAQLYAVNDTELKAIAQIKSDYVSLLSIEDLISEYEKIVSDTTHFDILNKALEAGQLTMLDYLNEVRYWLDVNERLFDMQYDYNLRYIGLSKYSL